MQQRSRSPEEDAVAAFYARVMQRVCASFRELDTSNNADVAALIKMWQKDITLVALDAPPVAVVGANAEAVEASRSGVASSRGNASGTVVADTRTLATTVGTESRLPQRSAAGCAVGSSGNSILGAKRKISQMDGVDEDDDGDSDGVAAAEESSEVVTSPLGDDGGSSDVLTTSSSEVSAVLTPVWGLPVSGFSSQLSARSAKFKYRRKFRDFHGRLSAIILTLTRPLLSRDIVHPGHFLWLNDERVASSGEASSDGSRGWMVEVVRLSSERLDEIYVKLPDGLTVVVDKASTQRFYECIIARGVLQLAVAIYIEVRSESKKQKRTEEATGRLYTQGNGVARKKNSRMWMGITLLDGGCFPERIDSNKIACEGLLQYQGKAGKWKERWFVLDSDRSALVKCVTSNRQRSRSGALGGDVYVKDVHPLSRLQSADKDSHNQEAPQPSACTGLEVTTQKGSQIHFRTKSIDEEKKWIAAITKLSSGFTAGVEERLAERELLAGKFSLVRELGRGASGIVSLYTWQGKPFAIKKFVPQKAKGIPNRRIAPGAGRLQPQSAPSREPSSIPDDIRREIALLKKASSLPYVIQLHDVILDPEHGNYYLVMEYMGGGAIAEWDSERKCYVSSKQSKSISLLDESVVRRYTTHLLLGIQALHNHRLCHRDIKPENLMASEDKSMCKIGDLGVAHYFKEENGVLREEEDVDEIELWDVDNPDSANPSSAEDAKRRKGMLKSTKGTYQFLPPEALSGGEFCGFKADVWSIGVTMYALSFGFLPYYSNDLLKLFEKIESDPLVFPANCQDEDLKDLLSAILEKNPEKRITVDGILEHRWLHRNVNSKALQSEVRALKRSVSFTIADCDLGSAVSVLQSRFDAMSQALRRNNVDDMEACAVSASQKEMNLAEQQYAPRPIDSKECVLPKWLLQDTELIAAQLHYDWCHAKYMAGWSCGDVRDDSVRVHPCLMPMRSLPKEEQDKNMRCVVETMSCVVALGCHLRQPKQRHSFRHEPLMTGKITLSWEMMILVDLLAENSHEVWADGYVKSGWTFGGHFDAAEKRHPSLKPYMSLDEQEKDLSRAAVTSVLKACICLGYRVSCSRRKQQQS